MAKDESSATFNLGRNGRVFDKPDFSLKHRRPEKGLYTKLQSQWSHIIWLKGPKRGWFRLKKPMRKLVLAEKACYNTKSDIWSGWQGDCWLRKPMKTQLPAVGPMMEANTGCWANDGDESRLLSWWWRQIPAVVPMVETNSGCWADVQDNYRLRVPKTTTEYRPKMPMTITKTNVIMTITIQTIENDDYQSHGYKWQ